MAARNAAVSQVLSEPRISPLGQLSIAEWDEVKGGALVRKKTGKYWESFGHTEFGVSEETFKFSLSQCSILEVVDLSKRDILSGSHVDDALARGSPVSRRVQSSPPASAGSTGMYYLCIYLLYVNSIPTLRAYQTTFYCTISLLVIFSEQLQKCNAEPNDRYR